MSRKFTGNVLALDLATSTGWAWGKPGAVPIFGRHAVGKPGMPRGERYHNLRLFLNRFCDSHKTHLIVYESAAVPMIMQGRTRIETIRLLNGFAENLEQWAYAEPIELREATASQVRAHFIGQNLAAAIAVPKVIKRCHALGWMVENDDDADACALWDYQCCWLRPDLAPLTTPLFGQHT